MMHLILVRTFLLVVAMAATVPVVAPREACADTPAVWLDQADYPQFRLRGDEKSKADLAFATLDTPAGKKEGFRFTVREHCESPLGIVALMENPRSVTAKETLFAHFFMRTTSSEAESGEGKVQIILENNKSFEKSIQFSASAANEWKEFNLPFASKEDYAVGTASVIIRLGFRRQTVEIAGFEIKNYGASVAVSSLPRTKPDLNYPGMEANAPWRAAAAERIEKNRKSPLTVEVVDASGHPVAGVTVRVRQTRHAFGFGTAIGAKTLLTSAAGPDTRLSDAILQNFNLVTFENDLKWARWESDRELPLQAAHWCKEHGIDLRGHCMVWPAWRHLPPQLKSLESKPDELRQTLFHHIEDIGRALAPYATYWDVLNEPYNNHDLMDLLGDGILTESFLQARQAAPNAKLFINDYGIVTGNGLDRAHQNSYEHYIKELLAAHAPLEGIGIQGHFGQEFTPPERINSILDRFAQFGLPLQMTEFTAQADDRELDANLLRDVMTVFFSHPAADAFIFWGFYDGKGFEHKATLYDAEGQITPAGKVYRELVFHRWWTSEDIATAADGKARLTGFHGRYEVSVSHGGLENKQTVELKAGGSTLKIALGK